MSQIAKRVAARFLEGEDVQKPSPGEVLSAVTEVQRVLHQVVRKHVVPDDATPDEKRRLGAILASVKAMYDRSEEVRLDLDEWLIDYGEARKARP